jgi:hypothetical protein
MDGMNNRIPMARGVDGKSNRVIWQVVCMELSSME